MVSGGESPGEPAFELPPQAEVASRLGTKSPERARRLEALKRMYG